MPPSLSEFERVEAERKRLKFLAALEATGLRQADVVRLMTLAGEKTAPTTVNRWAKGKATISEATLRYVLSLMGLPENWEPPVVDNTQ